VIEAASGDEAVAILKSGVRVDLVLSDVRMPGSVDGLALLAFVREHFPKTPVIITSGHLPPDLALADGAAHFLAKPYQLQQAVDMIAHAMPPAE
jgi:DNA-binding NtrC family response regulator